MMDSQDYWRSIILYGRNVATYKIALGQVLLDAAAQDVSTISMPDLSLAFFRAYRTRLANGLPQMNIRGRTTLLERVVASYNDGSLTENQATEIVERAGFNDVVPRFHTVGQESLEKRFYIQTQMGLTITDALADVVHGSSIQDLRSELDSRWSLLEAAFATDYDAATLATDGESIYRARFLARISITGVRPVIGGYQNGLCFYCGDHLVRDSVHVDHLIPRSYIQHDDLWNLVLAHQSCNLKKSDNLPPIEYVAALCRRNEYFIVSNHPIREHLISATGKSARSRAEFYRRTFSAAQLVMRQRWRPALITTINDPLTPLQLIAE